MFSLVEMNKKVMEFKLFISYLFVKKRHFQNFLLFISEHRLKEKFLVVSWLHDHKTGLKD